MRINPVLPVRPVAPVSRQFGPYALTVEFCHGETREIMRGHNPIEVRNAHERVARNPAVISRIVLTDNSGPLETIWSRDWQKGIVV